MVTVALEPGGADTTRAAMAYLRGSDQRQQAIADELSRQAAAALGRPKPADQACSGTAAGEAS
jgi:hypothetical protein